jgi:hypothetical protein
MKLNVFIDGSWLFKICNPEGVLASKTESFTKSFQLSFEKLGQALLKHIQEVEPKCDQINEQYLSTSIFELPSDFDDWPNRYEGITSSDVESNKRNV